MIQIVFQAFFLDDTANFASIPMTLFDFFQHFCAKSNAIHLLSVQNSFLETKRSIFLDLN